MKKILVSLILVLGIGGSLFYFTFIKTKKDLYKQVREMEIEQINISQLKDGKYIGEFKYGSSITKTEIEIKNGEISDIEYIKIGDSKYAQNAAKGIKEKILSSQNNNVDAVAGATTTSKAILKSIELGLK